MGATSVWNWILRWSPAIRKSVVYWIAVVLIIYVLADVGLTIRDLGPIAVGAIVVICRIRPTLFAYGFATFISWRNLQWARLWRRNTDTHAREVDWNYVALEAEVNGNPGICIAALTALLYLVFRLFDSFESNLSLLLFGFWVVLAPPCLIFFPRRTEELEPVPAHVSTS